MPPHSRSLSRFEPFIRSQFGEIVVISCVEFFVEVMNAQIGSPGIDGETPGAGDGESMVTLYVSGSMGKVAYAGSNMSAPACSWTDWPPPPLVTSWCFWYDMQRECL